MSTQSVPSKIVQAAQSKSIYEAALAYQEMGFSVLPLKGKRPAIRSWADRQHHAATALNIEVWHQAHHRQNVGIVCGEVSQNLVVLDLDGAAGYPAFAAQFPELAETYTVATGGGTGKHVYWCVEEMPETVKAMGTPIGHLELCANGRQVVAPPSIHPDTQKPYVVEKSLDILQVPDLNDLVAWIESFKPRVIDQPFRPAHHNPNGDAIINPGVIHAIESHLLGQGFKQMRDWLHGPCIYPHRHKNGDRHPSFSFNTTSGYGSCFVCGAMLTKDVCEVIGIDPFSYGGLIEKPQHVRMQQASLLQLSNAPAPGSVGVPVSESSTKSTGGNTDPNTPDEPGESASISDLVLPDWIQMYLEWAGAAGNQTPMSFHLGAALWLLSVAIGRRLYAQAPWGVKIFPNLYLMMVASTTFYRKSTAYKLAEQIAREAIPHMLMPTPGSPERFQESLSGRMPANFDKLTTEQKELLNKAQPFAAQRGLFKDEVAGLFGALNRKDYMVGLKDMLMELYDCPEHSDKDTQAGLTIVENAALSILGVTTPSGLAAAVSEAHWSNGLLIRFGLLTPETNYQERPATQYYQSPPPELTTMLRALHEQLPRPEQSDRGYPKPIEFDVECWADCRAYGEHLRQLCNPDNDNELDERLKGVYGRMHVQAIKLAGLLASLDWLDSDSYTPTITREHWLTARSIADQWRRSAHRLVDYLDQSNESQREQRLQRRILEAFQRAGQRGEKLHTIYKNLHISAKKARHNSEELLKAGMLIPIRIGRSEAYLHKDFCDHPPE